MNFKNRKKRSVIYENWCESYSKPTKKETDMMDMDTNMNLHILFKQITGKTNEDSANYKRKLEKMSKKDHTIDILGILPIQLLNGD